VGADEHNARQVQHSAGQLLGQPREPPGVPGRGDALVGGLLGQAQLTDAPGEHRRVRLVGEQLADIHLAEVHHEVRGDLVARAHELPDPVDQVIIGQAGGVVGHEGLLC